MIDDPHGPLYSVVCTDTFHYGDWQTRLLEHTWEAVGNPGQLLRLVGATPDAPLPVHAVAKVIRTGATNSHPLMEGLYAGMNRLLSLHEWLDGERPVGTVLILDCDFVFREPIDRRAEPGAPIAQEWFAFGIPDEIAEAWERLTTIPPSAVQPVTWPLLIHTSDLRRIVPRWVELTARLRAEVGAWESDMFALVIVLAEYGLTCELETLGAWMDWPEEFVAGAPIIHYCQPVLDGDGEKLWYKQDYRPWDPIEVDPSRADLDYCRDFLGILVDYVGTRR